MTQYRKDPLTGRWVIIAQERAVRPNQFDIEGADAANELALCPFCLGNEDETPHEIDRLSDPDTENWIVRAVLNKYPAVVKCDDFPDYKSFQLKYGGSLDVDFPLSQYEEDTFTTPVPGFGVHELIVDTPRHVLCVSELSDTETFDMFRMYRRRLATLRHENRYAHALIFKNVGQAAGASLYHSHSQLMAMPFLPPAIQRELQRAIDFRREMDECFWCTSIRHEIADGSRIIEEGKHFVSLCPYVSRFPAETVIYPKSHISHFEQINDDMLKEFAKMVRQTVRILIKGADWHKGGRLAYNMILKSGPFVYSGPMRTSDISDSAFWLKRLDYCYENAYHFHLTILPSLAKAAGFEWGCGLHINPISPEDAAEKLRAILETEKACEDV